MFARIKAKCPHCGYKNSYQKDFSPSTLTVVVCDDEEGPGCGKYFAVSVIMVPVVTVFSVEEVETVDA